MDSAGERKFSKPFPLNQIKAQLLTQDTYYSGEKARLELRMPESPVSQAIEEAMEWFKMADFYNPNAFKNPSR